VELAFNIRTDEQPDGGFSVVIVFEPLKTEQAASEQANIIAERLLELGWDCDRVQ